jgi:dTDP-glucose 4,6-dehydratase
MRKLKSLLVTGGAGFIGSAFVRSIAADARFDNCEKIFILDSLTYAGKIENIQIALNDSRFEFIHGDINEIEILLKGLQAPDAVVHFAAESHVDRSISDGAPFIYTNIVGSFKLVEWARINRIGLFLHVSTDEVYGSIEVGSATEESNLAPSSQYSASKASSDLIVLANAHTFNQSVIVTRCTNNYGPYQDSEKLIPTIIRKAINDQKIPIYGSGLNVRDWLFVNDHVQALISILLNAEPGQILNISGDNEMSNLAVVNQILEIIGKPASLIEYVEDRKGHDMRYSLDSSKLKNLLGWKPQIEFIHGLTQTIDWYKSQPDIRKVMV